MSYTNIKGKYLTPSPRALLNARNRPKHKKSGIIQKALRRDIIDLWPQIQDKKFIPSPKVSNCSFIL